MSTFVLLHGAWHGGWAWQRVAPLLQAAGHEVLAPTLTGLSDRAHLLGPQVGLGTHVQDVVALLEAHDAREVVLVGHSYAGQVVTGVADRVPERLAMRIHLDAFVGDDGDAAIDLLPATVAGHYREAVQGPGFPAMFIECVDLMRVFTAQAERAAARGERAHHVATVHTSCPVHADQQMCTADAGQVGRERGHAPGRTIAVRFMV